MSAQLATLLTVSLFTCSGALAQTTAPQPSERVRTGDWCAQTMVGGYDAHGRRHEAWDEPAREALAAYARVFAQDPRATGDERDTAYFASRTAFQGGCKDPLLVLVAARNSHGFRRGRAEWLAWHIDAAHRIGDTQYHPVWKCAAMFWCAQYEAQAKQDPGAQADARRLFDAGLKLMPQVLADDAVPRSIRADLFGTMGDAARAVEGTREDAVARVMREADAQIRDRSLALTLMTRFFIDLAWDARGARFAPDVPADAWEPFRKSLLLAEEAGTAAWETDNTNGVAAKLMMRVALGQGKENASRLWFERACKVEPDNFYVYMERLQMLEPKWHGSPEAMVAFGRECVRQERWDGGIPFVLVEAHLTLSQYAPDGWKALPQAQYFRDHPEAWTDVKAVYDEYFKRTPSPSMFHRSRYAEVALWSGQYGEAAKQFEAMGDGKFSYGWFWNEPRYQRARAELAAHATGAR